MVRRFIVYIYIIINGDGGKFWILHSHKTYDRLAAMAVAFTTRHSDGIMESDAQLHDHRVSRWLLVQKDDGEPCGVRMGLYGGAARDTLLRPHITEELVPVIALDAIIGSWKGSISHVTQEAATVLRSQKDSSAVTAWLQRTSAFVNELGYQLIGLEDLMQVLYNNPSLRQGLQLEDDDNTRIHLSLDIWNLPPCSTPNQNEIVEELQKLAKEYDIEDDLWAITRFCHSKDPPPYDFQTEVDTLHKFTTWTAGFERKAMSFAVDGLQLAKQTTIPNTYRVLTSVFKETLPFVDKILKARDRS